MAEQPKVLLLNGPNLNLLGKRQPDIYGATTLAEIEAGCAAKAKALGLALEARQSNIEGELVTWVQEVRESHAAIIINPGAYSHTSIALLDALNAYPGVILEVHLSNIHQREAFRHHSYVSLAADGVIMGLGAKGYQLALEAVAAQLDKAQPNKA